MSIRHVIAGEKRGRALCAKAWKDYFTNPNICLNCGEPCLPASRKEKVALLRRYKFCTRKCAGQYNNAHPSPLMVTNRKKPQSRCVDCDTPITKNRRRCRPCRTLYQRTYGNEMKSACTHSEIRQHARQITSMRPQLCAWCGYSIFVETMHKKPVSSFPPTALLSEINSPDNLILGCPNHHWEFDHNLVGLPGVEPGLHDTAYEAAAITVSPETQLLN